MKNITKQQKAEARAYNDTIKNSMSIENKLEILYIDLIDYVANELGAEKMEAIDNIVRTFKTTFIERPYWSIDDEIVCIMYGYKRVKDGHESVRYFTQYTIEDLKKASEVVLSDKDAEKIVWKAIVDDIDTEQVRKETAEAIADKYYPYFYENLADSLNKIIDNYSKRGESLEPKVKELIAKKEANQ